MMRRETGVAPVIQIVPLGNLANRMLQYMAALRLRELVPGSVITPVALPEWRLQSRGEAVPRQGVLLIDRTGLFDLPVLAQRLNSGELHGVLLQDFLQDIRFYHDPAYYRGMFQPLAAEVADLPVFAEDELVINIRGGEILAGIDHYPLVPAGFYRDVVDRTGLRPVVMGQLDGGPYL